MEAAILIAGAWIACGLVSIFFSYKRRAPGHPVPVAALLIYGPLAVIILAVVLIDETFNRDKRP